MSSRFKNIGLIGLGMIAGAAGSMQFSAMAQKNSVGPLPLEELRQLSDAQVEYERQRDHDRLNVSDEHRARTARNSAYHRAVFLRRGKHGLYTNWVEFVTTTGYSASGAWHPLPGEKAVFFNPLTDPAHIDAFVARLAPRR